MVKDPLYRDIEERLAKRLDPDLFERCAVDLLRDVYPDLAPVLGAGDGGMDGAMSVPDGRHPIPLMATTGEDVIGNLTRNLKSCRSTGSSAGECVLATSQALTPLKRRNLTTRAAELGFVLRNIHDHADFVSRLYRNPAWRRKLLGLTGDPPALSALPRSPRPFPAQQLLGRDDELAWLRRARHDVVISGQPGVGKTALLGALAREGHGLFVVSEDLGQIADTCRELDPDRVFVDDAHLDAATSRDSLLGKLSQLRRELDMRFRIMATTWPGHEDDVRQALFLPRNRVRRVNPLRRSVMTDIVLAVSPRFTNVLIGEILDQSNGRPGLAVTLAQWAQRGELQDLASGQLLLSELKKDIRPSRFTLDALAAFALGGSAGMSLTGAAKALQVHESRLREGVLPVAGTGIVHEIGNDLFPDRALSVVPSALRHALVRRSFFSGSWSNSVEPVIEEVQDPVACTETLIGTLRGGASVPHRLVRGRLEEHDDAGVGKRLWEYYAWSEKQAVDWVLGNHSEKTELIAAPALEFAPDRALEQMIPDVIESRSDGDALGAHGRNWVLSGYPGAGAVERRHLLLQKIVDQTDLIATKTADSSAPRGWENGLTRLLQVVFALHFENIRGDRVTETGFKLASGSLSGTDVSEIARFWPTALGVFRHMGLAGVSCAREIVRRWTNGPGVLNERSETRATAREKLSAMLPGVIALADNAPGVVLWAQRLIARHRLQADLPRIDVSMLRRLFPALGEMRSHDRPERKLHSIARAIAVQWRDEPPKIVVARMSYYEQQRVLMDHHYPDILKLIPNQLAQVVASPMDWLEALVAFGRAPPDWITPFLEAATATHAASDTAWSIVASDPRLESVAVDCGVRVGGLGEDAVRHIMAVVPNYAQSVGNRLPCDDMPREWKHRLLEHPDPRVRGATAAGLWEGAGGKRPGGVLGTPWQAAVVECGDTDLLLEVLRSDSDAARAWTLHKARESKQPGLDDELVLTARDRMTIGDRRDLILAMPPDADLVFFRHLVGTEPELYATLLGRSVPAEAHLAPLKGGPPETLVGLARKHGYTAADIEVAQGRRTGHSL